MSRDVPASMTEGWKSPAKIGDRRPIIRATIQRQNLMKFEYDTAWSQGGSFEANRHRTGQFTSMIFGDFTPYREIRNIQTCEWERSTDQDAATCTITLLNSDMTAIGEARDNPTSPEEFDKPGYFTYNRGERTVSQNRWGYDEETGWNGIFVPDMIVKTYEGYGSNRNVSPPSDPNLVQSGTWMIDRVTYTDDGMITLEMRDLARLLLDQIVFPPSIPAAEYPLSWIKNHSENVPARDAKGGDFMDRLKRIGHASSSNDKYVGKNLTNRPFSKYVSDSGGVDGHHAAHAIADHRGTDDFELFWRSTGQDSRDSFVWWQFDVDDGRVPLAALRLRMAGGPYRVYVSIHDGEKWVGKKKIGWSKNGEAGSPGNIDIDAKIPFVTSQIADRFYPFDVVLPRKYNAKKIRLTFTHLTQVAVGEHPYRAGFRELQIYTANQLDDLRFEKGKKLKVVGNYGDYTHIVKWVCAWAGFFWPPHSTGMDFMRVVDESGPVKDWITYNNADPALPKGRVWGDFMQSGTAGVADLTVDMFDKKPLMDVINYVRDLLGFNFFIDEMGGVVWRMPNLWSLGNYKSPQAAGVAPAKRGRGGRTSEIVVIDEKETLLDYQTTLDSANIRERIFVANGVGGVGTVIKGFNPYPIGLRRTAGWSDQNFKTKRETRVMADMISAQQMFSYKISQITTPGYPKIQIDDQIRVFERVTNETFYHYVRGIKSSINMEDGTWTYDITTNWLGERPSDAWVVKVEELDGATRQYLNAIGYNAKSAEDNDEYGIASEDGG